jgi:hypothetical protein
VRDIVWTVIVIWVVWKIYDAFKNVTKTQNQGSNGHQNNYRQQKEGEVKIDKNVNQKTHINPNDAEYVDYEEIK